MFGKKKIKAKELGTSFDRLLNYNLREDVDIEDQKIELADAILGNCPVLINFDGVKNVNFCNRVLSFWLGVIYAIEGEAHQIGNESYLIASKKAFEDGSLNKWIKEFGRTYNAQR